MRGRAYSLDLRERVIADYDSGMTAEAVAKKYKVSAWWVYKLKGQRKKTGSIAPLRQGGHKEQLLSGKADLLKKLVEEHPDWTLEELRKKLKVKVHLSVLWYAIDRLGLTYKKNPARIRAREAGRTGKTQGMEENTTPS